MQRPDPYPCGNPLPAIRVQRRVADVLTFSTERGERVSIPPLAFEVEHIPGIEQIQVVQRTPTSLRVRLQSASRADSNSVWQAVQTEITRMLAEQRLAHVTVGRLFVPLRRLLTDPNRRFRTALYSREVAIFVKLIAALCLCAISSFPAVGRSLVLCIGANQHLSIEELFANCCGRSHGSRLPGSSQTSGNGAGAAQSAPACGSCVDIPLLSTAENKVAVTAPVHSLSRLPAVAPACQTSVFVVFVPQLAVALPDTAEGTSQFADLNSVLRC